MSENISETRIKEIYRKYQDIVAPFIVELETRDTEYPIEIFNEIRAIFTHLSRYELQGSSEDISAAEGHMKRAVWDCFKYICISISEKIYHFREEYRTVDLKLADNGKFLPELNRRESIAREAFLKAKKEEIKKISEDELYVLYEEAYNRYSELDKFLDDSWDAVLFASSHSKRSNRLTVVSCIITFISIIVAVIALL